MLNTLFKCYSSKDVTPSAYKMFPNLPWLVWLSGLSMGLKLKGPENWKVSGSIPSQGTCLGCGPGPQLGRARGNQLMFRTSMFFFLFPSLPLSLKKKENLQNVSKLQKDFSSQHLLLLSNFTQSETVILSAINILKWNHKNFKVFNI